VRYYEPNLRYDLVTLMGTSADAKRRRLRSGFHLVDDTDEEADPMEMLPTCRHTPATFPGPDQANRYWEHESATQRLAEDEATAYAEDERREWMRAQTPEMEAYREDAARTRADERYSKAVDAFDIEPWEWPEGMSRLQAEALRSWVKAARALDRLTL
jgi:hypothetical protein